MGWKIALTLVLTAQLGGALAQEKAVDPARDERLNRPLSLRIVGLPLHRALRQMTDRTGVVLRVDDSLREYRVVLSAPDQPLHLVMEHLAQAFGYEWKRIDYEDEPPVYRLIDPNPTSAKTDPDWEWFRREFLPRVCQQLQTPIGERIETGYAQLKPESELRDMLSRMVIYAGIGDETPAYWALCQLSDAEWARLQRGEILFFSTGKGTLPPQALDEWKAIAEDDLRRDYEFSLEFGAYNPQELKESHERKLSHAKSAQELRVYLWYDSREKELRAWEVALNSEGQDVKQLAGVGLMTGNSRILDTRRPERETVRFYDDPEVQALLEPTFPKHRGYEKKLERYRYPGPEGDWFSWLAELMVQMARTSNICLVAEYYPFEEGSLYVDWSSKIPRMPYDWARFYRLLHDAGYRAVLTEQEWLVLSHRNRDRARQNDLPQPVVERWFYKPNYRGILTLEECAEVANLPEIVRLGMVMHLQEFFTLDGVGYEAFYPTEIEHLHGGVGYANKTLTALETFFSVCPSENQRTDVRTPKYALRLFGQLSPAQRALLRRGGALPFLALDFYQQVLFLQAISGGDLLTIEALWLPPEAQQEVFRGASVRLMADECERRGVRLADSEKERIRTVRDWFTNRASIFPERSQVKVEPITVRHRVWRFEFSWDGQVYRIPFTMPYPVEREPK